MPARLRQRRRAAEPAPLPPAPEPEQASEDDVSFKTSRRAQHRRRRTEEQASDEDEVTFKTSRRAQHRRRRTDSNNWASMVPAEDLRGTVKDLRGAVKDLRVVKNLQDDEEDRRSDEEDPRGEEDGRGGEDEDGGVVGGAEEDGAEAESDDEAPEAVGLADSRREAELLLEDLAASRRRRDDARRKRDQERQERNREQKADKQKRMELELMEELAADLAENEEEGDEEVGGLSGKRVEKSAAKPKKKRFKYPTPEVASALDFIPLEEGDSTAFKAAALPESTLPAVVNPQLVGLKERLLYGGRIRRTTAKGLKQLRHKQAASGKYGRR